MQDAVVQVSVRRRIDGLSHRNPFQPSSPNARSQNQPTPYSDTGVIRLIKASKATSWPYSARERRRTRMVCVRKTKPAEPNEVTNSTMMRPKAAKGIHDLRSLGLFWLSLCRDGDMVAMLLTSWPSQACGRLDSRGSRAVIAHKAGDELQQSGRN